MKKSIVVFVLFALFLVSVVAEVQVGTIGAESVPTYEGCKNKRFGLVGASNTWDTNIDGGALTGSWSNVNIIKELCPGAAVFLQAKGGTWPGAQAGLVSVVLQNDDLGYVILDPSANGQQDSSGITPEKYKEAAIRLAQMVKDKNKGIKVIMLTNTPTKGNPSDYGSAKTIQRVKDFNADLLNNKLGKPDLIDYAVDTYSAIESFPGSDTCGYCANSQSGLGDGIHFGPAGRKKVMQAVMNKVFGQPAAPLKTTPLPSRSAVTPAGANCLNAQRCREIDEVWVKIAQWLLTNRKGKVWSTVHGWIGFDELYGPKTQSPQKQIPSQPSLVSSTGIEPLAMTGGDPYLRAFMRMITKYEGTSKTCNGISPYQILVGGSVKSDPQGRYGGKLSGSGCFGNYFKGYDGHPGISVEWNPGSPTSNAAGRYQFLGSSWTNPYSGFSLGGISDFTPKNQDEAVHNYLKNKDIDQLLRTGGTNPNVNSESFKDIWQNIMEKKRIGKQWASLPYACYTNQGCHKRDSQRFQESAEVYAQLLKEELGGGSFPTGGAVYLQNSILEKACTKESLECVIPSQNQGKREVKVSNVCPAGMVQVGNVCIDQYEAMLVERNTGAAWSPYCNPGNQINNLKAVSIAGVVPQTTINEIQAKRACENAGKRICTSQEWLFACQGSEGRKYPYGNELITGACNDQHVSRSEHVNQQTVRDYCPQFDKYKKVGWNENPWQIHPKNNQLENSLDLTGSNPQCKTPEDVYDLVGNIEDWVSDANGVFRGGFYLRSEGKNMGGCTYRTTSHPTEYYDYSLGFRCCASLG